MPLYVYACKACGGRCNVFKPLRQIDRIEPCRFCEAEEPMTRQVTAAMVRPDYPGYNCPITGDWIEGRRAHEENLKKHDCRVYEPGETEQLKRRRADEESRLDNSIGETVEKWIADAPAEKREALAVAEQMGITAEVKSASVGRMTELTPLGHKIGASQPSVGN